MPRENYRTLFVTVDPINALCVAVAFLAACGLIWIWTIYLEPPHSSCLRLAMSEFSASLTFAGRCPTCVRRWQILLQKSVAVSREP